MSLKVALLCLSLVIIAIGTADGCPCPRVYWPVCGSDGVTYPNVQCMRCHKPSLRVVTLGPCGDRFEADPEDDAPEQEIYLYTEY